MENRGPPSSSEIVALNPQTQCPLFDLPPEIRNSIYDLVLAVEPNIEGTVAIIKSPPGSAPSVLSILQTCRIINEEAQGIFYSINHLKLALCSGTLAPNNLNRLRDFLADISPSRSSTVRRLTLTLNGRVMKEAALCFKILRECAGLQSLHLHGLLNNVQIWMPQQIPYLRKALEREKELWKKAVGELSSELSTIELRFQFVADEGHQGILIPFYGLDPEIEKVREEIEAVLTGLLESRKTKKVEP